MINAETDRLLQVYQAAEATTDPENIYLFAHQDFQPQVAVPTIDFRYKSDQANLTHSQFEVYPVTAKAQQIGHAGTYKLSLPGTFNESNAVAAIITSGLAGASTEAAQTQLAQAYVPGRMESLKTENHRMIYAEYAHNYASLKSLLKSL